MVFSEIKPLGILFFTILVVFLSDSYFETKNYSAYHLQYAEEMDYICNCFLELQDSLLILKKESPSTVRVFKCQKSTDNPPFNLFYFSSRWEHLFFFCLLVS